MYVPESVVGFIAGVVVGMAALIVVSFFVGGGDDKGMDEDSDTEDDI